MKFGLKRYVRNCMIFTFMNVCLYVAATNALCNVVLFLCISLIECITTGQ